MDTPKTNRERGLYSGGDSNHSQEPLVPLRPPRFQPTCPSLGPAVTSVFPFAAEYQILCGNQAPGFIIDIHTGKPIGESGLLLRLCSHPLGVSLKELMIGARKRGLEVENKLIFFPWGESAAEGIGGEVSL